MHQLTQYSQITISRHWFSQGLPTYCTLLLGVTNDPDSLVRIGTIRACWNNRGVVPVRARAMLVIVILIVLSYSYLPESSKVLMNLNKETDVKKKLIYS